MQSKLQINFQHIFSQQRKVEFFLWKHSLHILKYLFSRNNYVYPIWIFIFDIDHSQILSVLYHINCSSKRNIYMWTVTLMSAAFFCWSFRRGSRLLTSSFGGSTASCNQLDLRYSHRVHRVATDAFWRTFHQEGKISPDWWGCGGGGARPHLSLHLASPVKLQCTLQLSTWADTLTLFHL